MWGERAGELQNVRCHAPVGLSTIGHEHEAVGFASYDGIRLP